MVRVYGCGLCKVGSKADVGLGESLRVKGMSPFAGESPVVPSAEVSMVQRLYVRLSNHFMSSIEGFSEG